LLHLVLFSSQIMSFFATKTLLQQNLNSRLLLIAGGQKIISIVSFKFELVTIYHLKFIMKIL